MGPHDNQSICVRCGGDLNVPNSDDPCKCDDPIPTQDNKLIEFVNDLTNDRNAYKTLLVASVGRDVTAEVKKWRESNVGDVGSLEFLYEATDAALERAAQMCEILVPEHYELPKGPVKQSARIAYGVKISTLKECATNIRAMKLLVKEDG